MIDYLFSLYYNELIKTEQTANYPCGTADNVELGIIMK